MPNFRVDPVANRELQAQHASRILDAQVGTTVNGIKVTERLKSDTRRRQVEAAEILKKAGGVVSLELPGGSAINNENGEPLKETDYKNTENKSSSYKGTTLKGENLKRTYRAVSYTHLTLPTILLV